MRTPTVDFVGRRRVWLVLSAVLVAVSALTLVVRGLDLSIDFVGGSSYQLIDVREGLTAQELRGAVERQGVTDVVAQLQTDAEGSVGALVRTEALEPGGPEAQAVETAIVEVAEPAEMTFEFVGPVWGERITRQAVEALVVFLVVVFIYISFRLEYKMAAAAVIALAHDVFITIGLYALVGFNVSPATVIALLTILGYSLYDTVVVFDRVKENRISLGDPGRRTYDELVNGSMNEVLYRSINTSVTSLLPVGGLLLIGARLLGATTLQDLALALFIGMAVGVYSSLFVAGPFLAWWKMREPDQVRAAARLAKERGEEARSYRPSRAAAPESRAPITTDYVRGEGRRGRRRRR